MKYIIGAALVLASLAAHSQELKTSGAYMGFGLGYLDYEESEAGFSFSDSTTAYRLLGGYRFSENFAVEGGWGATSDLKDTVSVSGVSVDVKGDYEIMSVRALGTIPLDSVSLFGGVGYYDAELSVTASVAGFGSISADGNDSGAALIGGVEFLLNRVSLRAEYEWFDTDSNIDASTLGLGLLFSF